jgi:hypothetical protein
VVPAEALRTSNLSVKYANTIFRIKGRNIFIIPHVVGLQLTKRIITKERNDISRKKCAAIGTQSSSSAKLNEIYYYVHPTRIILKIRGRLESLLKYSGEETTTRKKVPQQNLYKYAKKKMLKAIAFNNRKLKKKNLSC